jgi:hypothetical protein
MRASEILQNIGMDRTPAGTWLMADLAKADTAPIHHSSIPVAVAAFALTSVSFCRGRFPRATLSELVCKRPVMDGSEAVALAAACDIADLSDEPPIPHRFAGPNTGANRFHAHLCYVIGAWGLDAFFGRDFAHPACNNIDVRPFGFDWRTDEIDRVAMASWRRGYRELPAERQMLVATIMWLYRGGRDKTWLTRVPCAWHAADAIAVLKSAGALRDWAILVALYPGW